MQAFKTLLIVVVLAAVAYGVYMSLTGARDVEPPPGATTDFDGAPQIELPSFDSPPATSLPVTSAGPPAGLAVPAAPTATAPLVVSPPAAATEAPPRYPQVDHSDAGAAPPFVAPGVGPSDAGAMPSAVAPVEVPDVAPLADPPAADAPGDRYPSSPAGAGGLDASAGLTPPPVAEAMPASDFATDYAAAQTLLQENRLDPALLLLSRWYDNPSLTEQEQHTLQSLLNQIAGSVIYSREHYLLPAYEVQPGDTLDRVAQRYQVPWQLLAKINGVADPNQLPPGEKLKVVQGPFDAVVNLQTRRLTLFLGGRYAGSFPCGVGSETAPPADQFTVKAKTPNPTYYGPEGVVQAGDPSNPLGKYWIGLDEHLGIHGTNDPQSIGRADPRGSIRLSPRDIEDVYDILTAESHVRIYR